MKGQQRDATCWDCGEKFIVEVETFEDFKCPICGAEYRSVYNSYESDDGWDSYLEQERSI